MIVTINNKKYIDSVKKNMNEMFNSSLNRAGILDIFTCMLSQKLSLQYSQAAPHQNKNLSSH